MKTNEFIKEVKAIGFIVAIGNNERLLEVRKQDSDLIATVTTNKRFYFYNNHNSFYALEENKKQQLFNLLTEYASTPVEEREEEKKYMYRIKKVDGLELNGTYVTFVELNSLSGREGYFILDYLDDRANYKQVFTHSWLKKHGVDIEQLKEVCDEIEVEE